MLSGSLITPDDLLHRFGERELAKLTDRAAHREIDETVLQQAISDAQAEVYGYLRAAGFRLPLAQIPSTLVVKTCDICRWYLYENGTNEIVQMRYQNAILWLKAVVKQPAMLGLPVENTPKQAMAVIPNDVSEWRDVKGLF